MKDLVLTNGSHDSKVTFTPEDIEKIRLLANKGHFEWSLKRLLDGMGYNTIRREIAFSDAARGAMTQGHIEYFDFLLEKLKILCDGAVRVEETLSESAFWNPDSRQREIVQTKTIKNIKLPPDLKAIEMVLEKVIAVLDQNKKEPILTTKEPTREEIEEKVRALKLKMRGKLDVI